MNFLAQCRARFAAWLATPGKALPLAFVMLVLPLGLAIGSVTPLGEVTDEPAHVGRAEALLGGELIGSRVLMTLPGGHVVVRSGVHIDPAAIWACFPPMPPALTPALMLEKSTQSWTGERPFVEDSAVAAYPPVFYIPAAIGLGLARSLGALPFAAVYSARLAMFLGYAVLGGLALLLARRGQAMIFIALSMPMALSLGASCNPDGLLIATSALGAALISRGAARAGAVCLGLVILMKPPYALLVLLLWLPLPGWRASTAERRQFMRRLGLSVLAVLPGALWLAYALQTAAAPALRPPYHPGPLWPGDPATMFFSTDAVAQLHSVLTHPWLYTQLFWTSATTNPYLGSEVIGYLGWLNIPLPQKLYAIWLLGAAGALVAGLLEPARPGPAPAEILLLLTGLAGSIFLIWLSQYLTWTNVGAVSISGPTGRYLLPLFPMLGMALPAFQVRGARWVRGVAICLPVMAVFITFLVLPGLLAERFYLS